MKNKNKKIENPQVPNDVLRLVLVQGKDGEFYKFPSRSNVHLTQENINMMWEGWEKFHETTYLPNRVEGPALFHRLTGRKVPRTFTPEDISMHIFAAYCVKANDRTVRPVPEGTEGAKSRKTLSARIYELVMPEWQKLVMPPQAKTCLQILADSCTDGKVTEEVLEAKIHERAAEIKTRQDPWRIFQYYRARMISDKVIRYS